MNIRKHILILLFSAFFLLPAGKSADIAFQPDTTVVSIRLPIAKHIAEYHKQKAFNYERKYGSNRLWAFLRQWLFDKINRLFNVFDHPGSIEIFLIILITLAIIAIILKINNINPIALFMRKDQIVLPSFNIGNENIADMNFPDLIGKACKQGNYRLAVRYQYLETLAILATAGKIKLRDQTTNRQYLSELGSGEISNIFAKLVYGFEFTWYGEFIPDEKQYLRISAAFIDFKKTLQE